MQKSSSFLLPSLPKGVQIKPNVCQKTWNCSAANFFMKEIAKHSKMHCNMFFHSILYPFLPYYSGNTLDSLSVICAALTCTFSTMTKSTFCNATTNYGDSEALQKCLILSAKINHFANQSNYSMTQVWNWSVQAVGEEGEECDEERSSSKIKEIWRSIFVDHQSLLYIWSDLKWCRVGCPGPTREAFSGPQLKLDPPYEVGHFPEKKILDFWLPQFHSRAMTVYIPKYTRKAFQQYKNRKRCRFWPQANVARLCPKTKQTLIVINDLMQILLKKSNIITAVQSTFVCHVFGKNLSTAAISDLTRVPRHESLPPIVHPTLFLSTASFFNGKKAILCIRDDIFRANDGIFTKSTSLLPWLWSVSRDLLRHHIIFWKIGTFFKLPATTNGGVKWVSEWVVWNNSNAYLSLKFGVGGLDKSELSPARASIQIYRDSRLSRRPVLYHTLYWAVYIYG